ncbi:Transposable element Tcb1 transposase, partial [Stegodyphus mimosarum]
MITGFRAKGGSISETALFVNCSRAAVVKVYRAWQNGTVQNQRRGKCGAPRAIDDRGERRLRRCVRADRRATVEQLTTKMNQGATKSVSQSTIQRTLLRLGLRSRRLVRAPMLTAVHRRRRLEFARQYSSWTSTEWRQVAFSDESRFMLHRTDGRWRIRRETSERNHPATIAGTVQAGGGSIMVWGMFSWHSLGSLIIVEGTMDQYKYASVLADHVHPYMRIVFPQDDGIFQQDNARCHTAASVRAWFEEHQDEFTVLPWPANSPDLNPIEHLWDHLDRVVRAMDPQPRNLAQLATALESAWLNIPENTFRDLCDSLPARLAAVRSAKEEERYERQEPKQSLFTDEIGRAVVGTQIIFRDEFELIFQSRPSLRMGEDSFDSFVNECIVFLVPTGNIIDKTVASCMIYAEFTLYQRKLGNEEYLQYLMRAPKWWSDYFLNNLYQAFDAEQGWTKLRVKGEAWKGVFANDNLDIIRVYVNCPLQYQEELRHFKNLYLPGYKAGIEEFLRRQGPDQEASSSVQATEG